MNFSHNPISQNSGENPIAGIKCDVTNCKYNDQHSNCIAKEIYVGPQFASCSADSFCATFKPQ